VNCEPQQRTSLISHHIPVWEYLITVAVSSHSLHMEMTDTHDDHNNGVKLLEVNDAILVELSTIKGTPPSNSNSSSTKKKDGPFSDDNFAYSREVYERISPGAVFIRKDPIALSKKYGSNT